MTDRIIDGLLEVLAVETRASGRYEGFGQGAHWMLDLLEKHGSVSPKVAAEWRQNLAAGFPGVRMKKGGK